METEMQDLINKISTLNGYLMAWEIDKIKPLELSKVITECNAFIGDWYKNNKNG